MESAPTPQPTEPPFASVVVPVYNQAETLGYCLQALSAQTIDAQRYEVLVVDDGSTDGSAAVAEQHGVTLLRQTHGGAAAARNRGARVARGQILLFTDADCEPLPDWIEQMLRPFAAPDVAGVKGVYRTRQRSLVARFAQAEYEEKYDRLTRADRIDFVDTYAAAYRRDVFEAHGGFDPAFQLDEDQEFSFRLARAGHKLVFAPEAAVYHRHVTGVWDYARRKVGLGRWKVRVHARHPAKALRDSYTPGTQKAQLALLPLALAATLGAICKLITWRGAAVLWALGGASIGPLVGKAMRQGPGVALAAPLLAALRALALDAGILWGLAGWLWPDPG